MPVPATIEAVRAGAAAMGGCALRVRGALELTLPRGVIEGEALEVISWRCAPRRRFLFLFLFLCAPRIRRRRRRPASVTSRLVERCTGGS